MADTNQPIERKMEGNAARAAALVLG